MTSRFADHILGPDTHANRPSASTTPYGALYECTTHNLIYKNVSGVWTTWAAIVPNGGTAGQVLAKNSSTDGDTVWSAAGGGASTSAARATTSSSQSFTHNVEAAITWETEDFDDASYHDNTTNNTRLTIPGTGRYRATFNYGISSTKVAFFSIKKNGSTYVAREPSVSLNVTSDGQCFATCTTGPVALSSGDYLEAMVLHFKSAGSGTATRDSGIPSWFTLERIT